MMKTHAEGPEFTSLLSREREEGRRARTRGEVDREDGGVGNRKSSKCGVREGLSKSCT